MDAPGRPDGRSERLTVSATKLQKAVDAKGAHTYMAHQRRRRSYGVGVRFVPLLSRYNRCPEPIEPGEDARRLFDIVGLDEGTCGRRPGHLEPLGSGWTGKIQAVPFGIPSKLASMGMLICLNMQTHQVCELCRNGSQRCRFAPRIFLRGTDRTST
jgi:hypothetical protein